MTLVIGYIDKETDTVVIGADSQASSNYIKNERGDAKVFRRGDFIFAFTTSYRMGQLLQHSLLIPQPSYGIVDHYYMTTQFIDAVKKCFSEGGYAKKEGDGEDKGGTFLVAYKNQLYEIQDDYQVCMNKSGIHCAGSGMEYGYGAMHILDKLDLPAKTKVKKALEAGAKYNPFVGGPFKILITK